MLSSTSGSSSSSNLNNSYQQLINSIIASESAPKLRMSQKKSDLKIYKSVLTDLGTKLSGLNDALDAFTSLTSNPFDASTAASADSSAFGVSSGADAPLGTHSLSVNRLAQTDTRVTKQFTSSASDLRTYFDSNGAQTFAIEVAKPTDADPKNRASIAVTVNPTGSTNKEILEEITASINSAMSNAVDDGTLESGQKAQVSVVEESSGTVRLSLRSGQTGYTNRLGLTDTDGLLGQLDLTAADTTTSDGSGGQIYAVGTGPTDSTLNSAFVLDGLTMYRDSNTVDDALQDVTLDLQDADSTQYGFSVKTDADAIKKDVNNFIKKFNDVQSYLKEKTKVDAESDTRGAFASDSGIRSLRFNLRGDVVNSVPGLPSSAPSSLIEVGIELTGNGTLELKDADKLMKAAEENPSALQQLFGGEGGIATRMQNRLQGYVEAGGIVADRKETVDEQINRLDNDITDFKAQLDRRRKQLTDQYARVQKTLNKISGQQQWLGNFFSGY